MKAIKNMLLGIAILLAAISFHLFNEGELGIFITIIGIIVVILGYSSKDEWYGKFLIGGGCDEKNNFGVNDAIKRSNWIYWMVHCEYKISWRGARSSIIPTLDGLDAVIAIMLVIISLIGLVMAIRSMKNDNWFN